MGGVNPYMHSTAYPGLRRINAFLCTSLPTVTTYKPVTIYPRGMTSPKASFVAEVPHDPYQRVEFAKARAPGAEAEMGAALDKVKALFVECLS